MAILEMQLTQNKKSDENCLSNATDHIIDKNLLWTCRL